jgi:AcrR family transcriptional regulator
LTNIVPRENHKQKLLEGALECLRTKGFAATTSRDIAAAAGANLGSIGYHFGSKQALMNEAVILGFRNWTEHLAGSAQAVDADDPLQRLRLSWDAMSSELEDQRGLLQAFLEALAPASRSPELRAQLAGFYREARTDVAKVVGESFGDDRESKAAAMIVASLLIAVFDGLQLQWLLEREQTPSADEIGKALGHALSATPG